MSLVLLAASEGSKVYKDNPEATQKFQLMSDAYRVLGDEDRRKLYDEHGQPCVCVWTDRHVQIYNTSFVHVVYF